MKARWFGSQKNQILIKEVACLAISAYTHDTWVSTTPSLIIWEFCAIHLASSSLLAQNLRADWRTMGLVSGSTARSVSANESLLPKAFVFAFVAFAMLNLGTITFFLLLDPASTCDNGGTPYLLFSDGLSICS